MTRANCLKCNAMQKVSYDFFTQRYTCMVCGSDIQQLWKDNPFVVGHFMTED